MYIILFVLHDCEKMEDLLDAWEEAGVRGATILRSSGMGRLHQMTLRDDLPLMPSLDSLFDHEEYLNRTLFTVVDDEAMIDRLVEVTQGVVGNLSQPETGFMVVLPALRAYGLNKDLVQKE